MVAGTAGVVARTTAAPSAATNSTADKRCPGLGVPRLPLRPCPALLRARVSVSAAMVRCTHSRPRFDERARRRGRSKHASSANRRAEKSIQFSRRQNAETRVGNPSLRLLPLSSLLLSLLSGALTKSLLPARNSETQIQKRQNAAQTGSDDVSAPSSSLPSPSASSSSPDASSSSRAPRRDWRPNAFQKNDDELHT